MTKFTQLLTWLGYALAFRTPTDDAKRTTFFKTKFYWSLALSGIFWIFDLARIFLWPDVTTSPVVLVLWTSVAFMQILTLGVPFMFLAIRHWQLHLSKLPALIAVLLSFVIVVQMIIVNQNSSYIPFIEITSFILLVLGYLFYVDQKNSSDAHAQALSLNRLMVPQARLWQDDKATQTIPTSEVKVGDKILVFAGEAIARDGVIVNGMTSVDESAITLEKNPLHKARGDTVFAGTINRDSDILIEVQQPISDDILSLILNRAEGALQEKSPLKQRAIFISRFFPLFFMIAAAIMGFVFQDVKQRPIIDVYLAIIATLLASPLCLDSLGRITLVRLVANIFKKGILVSRAVTIEMLGAIHTLFFNKTGILTDGLFIHSQDVVQSGNNLGSVLSVFFSLEEGLDHPLAKAMSTHPWYNEIQRLPVLSRTFFPGLGVSGVIRLPDHYELPVQVGNLRFMKRQHCQISKELKNKVDELEALGETVILCGYEKQIRGIMTFADTLRRNVRRTLKQINQLGIKTALITGDTEKTITQVLGALHFDQIYSRCTPEEKVTQIDKIQKPWNTVALVTDDLQSQSFANAKITISTDCGLDIRKHPADVIVMGSNIQKLSWLLQQTRIYRRALRTGLWGSAIIGVAALSITYFGEIKPQYVLTVSALWSLLLLENISKLKIKD